MNGRGLLVLAVGLAVLLAGCGHMPVTSMIRLARADLTTTDPSQLRAAVKLPRVLRLRPQGVALRIAVRLANGKEDAQEFRLREVSEPNDVLALHHELGPDTHIFAYRLERSEAARLATFRDGLKAKQSASGGRGGAITISVRPDACQAGDLPAGAVLVTTYLRTAETGGYVPLARDLDLRTINPGQDHTAKIPPCG
jgi:hypothetical protein